MTVGQKASLSLLVSTILAAGFAVLAFSGVFSVVETRFFDARVRSGVEDALESLARSADTYHSVNLERFGAVLAKDYVARSFLPNQGAEDLFQRTAAFGRLVEETPGLEGVRFLDTDGKRLHFSTFPGDIARRDELRVVYRNYGEENDEPFSLIAVAGRDEPPSVVSLGSSRSFVYRFPFVDALDVYRGTAVFYVSYAGLMEHLVRDGQAGLDDDPVPAGQGLLFGAPSWGGDDLLGRVAELWSGGMPGEPLTVGSAGASDTYIVFTVGS
ncbi:MAG: hypothetical protein KBB32_10215, partial [Spirochaetia bacterium]|nr:hypothetical protein [Spirochaetia bacterium]